MMPVGRDCTDAATTCASVLADPPRSVLIAPDKFKGTLSACEASRAIARGLSRALPDSRLYLHPVADGGEGSVDIALAYGFRPMRTQVRGPLDAEVSATFALSEDTAVIEMASAAGLAVLAGLEPSPQTALSATTYGVGQLIAAALDEGVTRIIVAVGGSATTDGGAGAIQALGARLTDIAGSPIPQGGGGLARAHELDLSSLDQRAIYQAEIIVACDVGAPLTGPSGAAVVFSPQKGADQYTTEVLADGLANWADVVERATGTSLRHQPGTGAAGGLAYGLAAALGARIASGIDVLLGITRFDQAVAECDLVVVGEGSLDAQSLLGKGPVGVARRAADLGVPSVAVVGRQLISDDEARAAGLDEVIALASFVDEERSMNDTAGAIEQVLSQVGGRWAGRNSRSVGRSSRGRSVARNHDNTKGDADGQGRRECC